MAKIGLAYNRGRITSMLQKRPGKSEPVIGLIFIPVYSAGGSPVFDIRQVYFDASGPAFHYETVTPANHNGLFRESSLTGALSPAITSAATDEIEFATTLSHSLDFGFFTKDELTVLKTLSNSIIVSGANMHTGLMAAGPAPTPPPFATLIAEVDPASRTLPAAGSDPMPTVALSMPCPPYWDTSPSFLADISRIYIRALRKKSKEKIDQKDVLLTLNKAWISFTIALSKEIRESRKINQSPNNGKQNSKKPIKV